MSSLISNLSKADQNAFFSDLYYLNMSEFKAFCDKHSIPYQILIETKEGKINKSRDKDRQKIIIGRIVHYLRTGKIKRATLFKKEVVDLAGLPENVIAKDRLYYGCYEKKNPKMIALLQYLTRGEFKNGAIARILCREFWTNAEAPTFEEYAKAWLTARDEYSLNQHPEAAYLTELSKGKAVANWKKERKKKADRVLNILKNIKPTDS